MALPEVNISLVPEEAGVKSLAHQIKLTGRAYPLFDIASLILKRPERYHVEFHTKPGADGQPIQPLYGCSLDDSAWLSEDEVAAHVLSRHIGTLYQTDKVPTDPPKGAYTLVAQCPMSKVILGPPNLHDYNEKLRKLHAERFSRMPFDAYKARIRMVTDEAVVKQWIEEQSFRNEYTCLNVPEPLKLSSREEVEKHFREHHLPNLVRKIDKARFPASGQMPPMSRALRVMVQRMLDEQRRFPLKIATVLSQQFARLGLQFFKVKRTLTHVCVARPRYLNLETTLVSDGVRRIVDYIREHEGTTRRELLEELAPSPEPKPDESVAAAPPAPPADAQPPSGQPDPPAAPESAPTDSTVKTDASEEESKPTETPTETASASEPAPAAAHAPEGPQPTPEQAAVIADLHWLIHQGHVIEFTNGRMELAKAPRPRPEQPAKKKKAAAEPATETTATPETPPPAPEVASSPKPAASENIASPAETPPPLDEAASTPATEPATESAGDSEAAPSADATKPSAPPTKDEPSPSEPPTSEPSSEVKEGNPTEPKPSAAKEAEVDRRGCHMPAQA